MNRKGVGGFVVQRQEESREGQRDRLETLYGEYFVVESPSGSWVVSREMAHFIERELDAVPRADWVRFVDVTGARIRVQSQLIRSLRQSSPETRDLWRRIKQERQNESPPDEPEDWDIDW